MNHGWRQHYGILTVPDTEKLLVLLDSLDNYFYVIVVTTFIHRFEKARASQQNT